MSISRLQLAAALLEYDNDHDDPSSSRPTISHRDSALFAPYNPKPLDGWDLPRSQRVARGKRALQPSPVPSARRDGEMMDGPYPSIGRRGSHYDYSGPSGMVQQGHAIHPTQYDTTSGHLGPYEEVLSNDREEATRPTVDVSGWGLPDHLLSPDADSTIHSPLDQHINGPDTIPAASYPRPTLPLQTAELLTPDPITSPLQSRATSIHLDLVDDQRSIAPTVRSGEKMEYLGENGDAIDAVLRQSEQIRIMAEETMNSARMIPLPPSPANTLHSFAPRPKSSLSTRQMSTPSLSALSPDAMGDLETPNPFALPPPPAALGSRFDPKLASGRGEGTATRPSASGSRVSFADTHSEMERRRSSLGRMEDLETDFGPSQLPRQRRPSSSSAQILDGQRETDRPVSKVWTDIPSAKEFGRPLMPNRYSTMSNLSSLRSNRASTLRPQNLYMPRPLSGMLPPPSPPKNIPDGYTLGDKPLPPGSRSSILSLANPRPGIPMSLSQRTFRDSLMVDSKRDGTVYMGDESPEGHTADLPEVQAEDAALEDEERRPGKLYGTSLMDQLEARKAAQRSKQRVFAGDNRPAMMARSSLVQPRSPNAPPVDDAGDLEGQQKRQTLLHVPSNEALNTVGSRSRLTKSTSVFGVDQIWEKELAKLKAREEEEARMEAEQAARDALEGKKNGKKDKGKGKAGTLGPTTVSTPPSGLTPVASPARSQQELGHGLPISPIKRFPDGPPRLSYSPAKAPPTVIPHLVEGKQRAVSSRKDGWSSDEDEDRAPKTSRIASTVRAGPSMDDSDSDEDVPLSKLVVNAPTPSNPSRDLEDDSDEDVPLSKLAASKTVSSGRSTRGSGRVNSKEASPTLDLDTAAFGSGSLGLDIPGVTSPTTEQSTKPGDTDEDDDVPLALRRPTPNPEDAEDDIPLGYRHPSAAGQDTRGSMYAFGVPSMSSFPSMQWQGMPGYPSYGMSPYGYPQGQMPGYPFPSIPSMPQVPAYYPSSPYAQQNYGQPETTPSYGPRGPWQDAQPMAQQQAAVKKIDSWRKEVAVAPAGSSNGSASLGRRSGGAVV